MEYMDWANVDRAVLLQGPFYGNHNEFVHRAARHWPDRFIGAGYLDLRSARIREDFKRIFEDFGFHIIKLEMSVTTGFSGLYPDLCLDD